MLPSDRNETKHKQGRGGKKRLVTAVSECDCKQYLMVDNGGGGKSEEARN